MGPPGLTWIIPRVRQKNQNIFNFWKLQIQPMLMFKKRDKFKMFKPEFSRKKNSDLSVVLSCQWDLLPNKTKNIKCRGRKRWKERKCPWLFLHLLYYFSWLSERHEDWNLRQKYKWCVEIFVQTIRDIICLQKSSWTFISKPLPSGIILHIISYDDEFFFPFLFLESIWRSKINDNW